MIGAPGWEEVGAEVEERATPADARKGMRPSGENSGDASAINEVGNDGFCVAENLGDVRSELKGRGQELFINDHGGGAAACC